MDEYVAKPVRERQLLTALRTVLGDEVPPLPDEQPEGLAEADQRCHRLGGRTQNLRAATASFCATLPRRFLEEHPRRIDEIRRAIDTSDWELLHRAAHTIKGSMRYFGAACGFRPGVWPGATCRRQQPGRRRGDFWPAETRVGKAAFRI